MYTTMTLSSTNSRFNELVTKIAWARSNVQAAQKELQTVGADTPRGAELHLKISENQDWEDRLLNVLRSEASGLDAIILDESGWLVSENYILAELKEIRRRMGVMLGEGAVGESMPGAQAELKTEPEAQSGYIRLDESRQQR